MKKVLLFILAFLPLCFFGCAKQNQLKLSAPQNLVVENGIITFQRVEFEEYYAITINNLEILADINNSKVEIYNSNNINYFAYNAQNLLTVGENYTIKVQARAQGKKSSDIVQTTYLHRAKLNTPTDVNVLNNILSWSAVENAEIYQIEIVAPNLQTSAETASRNFLDLTNILTTAGEYTFKIKAQTSNKNFLESDVATKQFENYVELKTPNNLSLEHTENLILSAQVDERANAVMLKINDAQKIVEKQNSNVQTEGEIWKINLTNLAPSFGGVVNFSSLGNYLISLQAVFVTSAKNFYISSAFSQNTNYLSEEKLASPQVELILDGNRTIVTFSSSQKEFIAGFKVEVDVGTQVLTYVFDADVSSLVLPESFVSVSVCALGKDFYLDSDATTVLKN